MEKNVDRFNQDVRQNQGYLYTATDRLSSRLANQRLTETVLDFVDLREKRVIDLGCGDGTYTLQLAEKGPALLLGVDASSEAIRLADAKRSGDPRVQFQALDVNRLGSLGMEFDVAIVRGLLHHLYDAEAAIAALCQIAHTIVVVEPNGYNPVLKGIERLSRYHVEHEEKSYPPFELRRWFKRNGGTVVRASYHGLVPFFCPNWMAKFLKALEPVFEALPLVRQISCAVYVLKVVAYPRAGAA